MAQHEQFNEQLLANQFDGVTTEVVDSAQEKLVGFESLKHEIDAVMGEAVEKIDAAEALIRANVRTEQNPDGLLTNEPEEYLDCLKIAHRELQELLARDGTFW